jgi:hypothetical protein
LQQEDANDVPYEATEIERYYFLKMYVDFIKKHVSDPNEPILVATGVNLKHDTLHFALKYLRTEFPNAYTLPKQGDVLETVRKCGVDQTHSMGRSVEIFAILDFIASTEAVVFLGSPYSSFSRRQGLFEHHLEGSEAYFLMTPFKLIDVDPKFNETDDYKLMVQLAKETKSQQVEKS